MTNYVDSLGLDFDPFEVDRRAAHFYEGGNREELLRQLVDQTHYGHNTLVVTGALGSGKSTIAQAFCRSFGEESDSVLVRASLFMNEVQLLELICDQAGVDRGGVTTEVELLSRLCDFASLLSLEAGSFNVVIDDAHELGLEAVEVLGELLGKAGEASIHLLLLGEKQLMGVLENTGSAPFASSLLSTFELAGFDVEDTANYLQFKLAGAGLKGSLPIPGADLGDIANNTAGIPGAINAAAREYLLELEDFQLEQEEENRFKFPLKYLAVAATLLIALLLVVFTGGEPGSSNATQIAGIDAVDALEDTTPVVTLNPDGTRSIQLSVPTSASSNTESAVAGSLQQNAPVNTEPAVPNRSLAAVASNVVSSSVGNQSEASLLTLAEQAITEQTQTAPASIDQVIELVSALEQVVEDSEGTSNSSLVGESETPSASLGSSVAALTNSPSSDFSNFENSLLAAPGSNFSLQLLGTHNEDSAKSFVDSAGSSEYGYIHSIHQGKPWFVVLYGNFSSRDAASSAISRLPDDHQKLGPWARSVAGVQADIRK